MSDSQDKYTTSMIHPEEHCNQIILALGDDLFDTNVRLLVEDQWRNLATAIPHSSRLKCQSAKY